MRLSTFLVGAAAGAAAVMYMNRNSTNKTVMMGFSNLGDNVSKALDKAMMTMADKGMKTYREPENFQSLDKVEELANCDPGVRSEVDKILTENQVATH